GLEVEVAASSVPVQEGDAVTVDFGDLGTLSVALAA
ncbi:MAG: hypothetical protein RI890_1317, partial [Actinomycetota bacterium]